MLRHRDRSSGVVDERLRRFGFSEDERAHVLETLTRTGLVDDERFALARAQALAGRGAGNALIEHDLERAGVSREAIVAVIETLEPELERAQRVVSRRGATPKTTRFLASKGFGREAIAAAVARPEAEELG